MLGKFVLVLLAVFGMFTLAIHVSELHKHGSIHDVHLSAHGISQPVGMQHNVCDCGSSIEKRRPEVVNSYPSQRHGYRSLAGTRSSTLNSNGPETNPGDFSRILRAFVNWNYTKLQLCATVRKLGTMPLWNGIYTIACITGKSYTDRGGRAY